ncbi:MAG: carboxypeptidase regulatory-like domain-containing protein [bacterium]
MSILSRVLIVTGLALLLGGAAAERAAAQDDGRVEVKGTVLDVSTDEPLDGVVIRAVDSYGDVLARRTTDADGRFALSVSKRAGLHIEASRLGYREVTTPFLPFDDGDLFVIEVRMDTEAVLLAPLTVVARSRRAPRPVLAEFDRRAEDGFGWYFTRDEIVEIQPQLVSDLLLRVPGVRVESGGGSGLRRTLTMARTPAVGPGGGPCPVQIFLDGRLITRSNVIDFPVDDLVTPEAVEGIEVYRGLSTVPPEFLTPSSRCGVVAIWTRRGGDG